jgi:hypothetical protein
VGIAGHSKRVSKIVSTIPRLGGEAGLQSLM